MIERDYDTNLVNLLSLCSLLLLHLGDLLGEQICALVAVPMDLGTICHKSVVPQGFMTYSTGRALKINFS